MKLGKTLTSIFSVLLMLFIYWLCLPTLSLAYIGGFCYFAFCSIVVAFNVAVWRHNEKKDGSAIAEIPFLLLIIFIVLGLLGIIIGSPLFYADTLYRQLGTVEAIEYNDMITQIDNAQIPIVDEDLARKQADKKIGEDIALGSRTNLGDVSIQEVNNEVVCVSPLDHSDFWKWNKFRTTPGYITVSASNPNKVTYVTEVNGEKIEIVYQPSAFFSNNLKRHIRNQGYRTVGLTEYTFELDDSGYPYWVVTTYKNEVLWNSPEATGVVIVDAQSGDTKWYSCKDAPDWVDIIQPKSAIEEQIDNWGTLVHGIFNWSDQDKVEKTDRTLTVYVEGDCYYFTGMTSVGNDNSCVGFVMVNTRTKESKIAYMSGATEDAAMKSAEGLVSDFGYYATEPLPLNVNGIPTYVMALKDEEGLIKSYAMVNIQNYSIAAKGNTLAEANRSYIQAVTQSGNTYVAGSDEAYSYTYEGIVERISSVVQDGSTYYYLVVEGEPNKIFTASYIVSDELSITRDGDTVKIKYIDDSNGTVDIIEFDSIAFSTPISEDQEKRNKLDEGASAIDSEYNRITEVNPDLTKEVWDSMTEEEKSKLIEEFLSNSDD